MKNIVCCLKLIDLILFDYQIQNDIRYRLINRLEFKNWKKLDDFVTSKNWKLAAPRDKKNICQRTSNEKKT